MTARSGTVRTVSESDRNVPEAAARNETYKIEETLPQYFHGEVLQRNLSNNTPYFGTIKFQVAFNLAVVWMIVFVSLSKGLRSYGKVRQASDCGGVRRTDVLTVTCVGCRRCTC